MLLKEFVGSAREQLRSLYPEKEAVAIAGILCRECLGIESYTYLIEPGLELSRKQMEKTAAALGRLLAGEPIQYVLGFSDFYGRRFNVNPSVLIPRPETETLCREAIEFAMQLYRTRSAYGHNAAPVRILDLCTGSGCIAWTLALNVPGAEVVAVDISSDALSVASSQPFDKAVKPHFVQADIFDDDAMEPVLSGGFDLIVSNPPYILDSERAQMRSNVLDYEPSLALFVPDDDAVRFSRKIAEISLKALKTDSIGIMEINEALGDICCRIFKDAGFGESVILRDIFGKNRFLKYSRK